MSNQAIMDKGSQYVMNTYGRFPIALVEGKGSWVWDADGNKYLDMICGIAVCGLGHAHPELVTVLKQQSEKLWHCSNLYWIEPQVELAEKLCKASGLGKAFFCNSGAEANESAIKLARKYFYKKGQDRYEIIAFKNSFHGRTTGALAATGQTKYQEGFKPLMPGVVYAEYNNLTSVEELITDHTCAVIVEPVQGEGGVNPADPGFLTGLRDLCSTKGILLILDEVQCGMGRTGKMFAFLNYNIKPDMVTLAKALGGGFPIGAMLATDDAALGFGPGDHASTFGGNPLACAVGSRMMDLLSEHSLMDNVTSVGAYLSEGLLKIAEKDERVVQVRGKGLMLGMECTAEVKELVSICIKNGMLALSAGPNVMRFVPPLNITREEVDLGLGILEKSLAEWK